MIISLAQAFVFWLVSVSTVVLINESYFCVKTENLRSFYVPNSFVVAVVLHIYPSVTAQCQMLTIGRFARLVALMTSCLEEFAPA